MPALAGAVHFYFQRYGAIPPSLEAIRQTGLGGRNATRLPPTIWEGWWSEHSGREVLYLPVRDWDGETEYVIGVQPKVEGLERTYIVTGKTTVNQATQQELATILDRDDVLRTATSQPGRWSQMPWK